MFSFFGFCFLLFFLNGCGKSDHQESQGTASGEILGESEIPISTPEEISQKQHYTIVEDTQFKHHKRRVSLQLHRKVSEETLSLIAQEVKKQDPQKYDRTFIFYHLPGEPIDKMAWAITHFNPDLKIEILGMSKIREAAVKKEIHNSSQNIVGNWIWEAVGATIVIYKENKKIYMKQKFRDGSQGIEELVKRSSPFGQRYDEKVGNEFGEYYVVDSHGNLQMRNPKRLFATAKKVI